MTDEPQLRKLEIHVCENCIARKPGECHMPGCFYWLHGVEDVPTYLDAYAAHGLAEMLAEFHEAAGQPFGHGDITDEDGMDLRIKLHREENKELREALEAEDLVGAAKELADVVYVAYGTAHALGIPLDAVLAAVHESNMTKFGPDGPVLRWDGKVLKSDRYVPPNVGAVLAAHCEVTA
jgi:predicted HAD superfamily Cof-like phosphohydrolase